MKATTLDKAIYWLATAIVLLLMGWSVVAYVVNHDFMAGYFVELGYPAYIIYPLAGLKLIAIMVILTNRFSDLKDMVYAAYFINMGLATAAHLSIGDMPYHAYVGLVAVPVSYVYSNRVRGKPARRLLDF